MRLTDRLDLRGGRNCWREPAYQDASDPAPSKADVAVIGAGIMGAMVAARLAEAGLGVVVLDRRTPATGATAASTALIMWAADVPLIRLGTSVGAPGAAARWRLVFDAVQALDRWIARLGLDCGWRARPDLYLAGDVLGAEGMRSEAAARAAAGLPSVFLDAAAVAARFGVSPRAGLVSGGCYEADPVALTRGLLQAARRDGAHLCFPVDVARLERDDGGVRVRGADGADIFAKHVVLASGYEAARLFLPRHFSLSSSYAIASAPGEAPAWAENALIWEAAEPYVYARATQDGRIIIGGEDEDFVDADKRDSLIPAKRAALEAKAAKLLKRTDIAFECAWAATFGGSPDGLPAIGAAAAMDGVILAYGYGGNGISFASLASEIVAAIVRGDDTPGRQFFDPYRFNASA